MFQKTIIAVGLVAVLSIASGCCSLFKINCPDKDSVSDAELAIFKQKAQVENDVDHVKNELYDKQGKLTKTGQKIQSAYNTAQIDGTAFVDFVNLKLTAGTANETDFLPQATKYAKAVDALHALIYTPLTTKSLVGTDALIAGIIEGLTKSGIDLYNNAQKNKVETVKRVTDDLNAKGKIAMWDDYMKKLKVIK